VPTGETRDKGAKALEAFAYRYPAGESTYERFRASGRALLRLVKEAFAPAPVPQRP